MPRTDFALASPFIVALLIGCGAVTSPGGAGRSGPGRQVVDAPSPAANPYEQLHAAAFQIGTALDRLHDALAGVKPLGSTESGPTKDALAEVAAAFDSAGRIVEDYSESPSADELKKSPARAEALDKKWSEDINQASRKILNAQALIDDLLASGPPENIAHALQNANDEGDEAVSALAEAVRQLGGKPVTGTHADAPAKAGDPRAPRRP